MEEEKREKTKKIICVILGICIGAVLTGIIISKRAVEVDAKISEIQKSLSEEVFRFHVLADSDSDDAQAVKLKVRDEVIKYIKELSVYPNIIVKFGRYVSNQEKHYDDVLGVYLASNNQYAERISND